MTIPYPSRPDDHDEPHSETASPPPRPPPITEPKAHIASLHPVAVEAITDRDTIIILENGSHLPGVPVSDAHELEDLRDRVRSRNEDSGFSSAETDGTAESDSVEESAVELSDLDEMAQAQPDVVLTEVEVQKPPADTNPMFPPLPIWGPPSTLRWIQCLIFRFTSSILSFAFLLVILLGAITEGIGPVSVRLAKRCVGIDPDADRPFIAYERAQAEKLKTGEVEEDALVDDLDYYARRVGLRMREEEVQTEDGFVLKIQRVVVPGDSPESWALPRTAPGWNETKDGTKKKPRYPVLLMHGLLQSSGAYCANEERSLAFYLAKCGYDVWLGNNRCHFTPQHTVLEPSDPRMWAWNICQMGNLDLPSLVSHVLSTTGFPKLGYVAHSQGTTQTFITLSSSQRPELGEKLSIFCALAPAVYAGGLVEKLYFRFMRIISPGMFRVWFGIHGFIPLMLWMRAHMPWKIYGDLGYAVFWFLFGWSDTRWDRTSRRRLFVFSPTLVSAESMRWWLGRECFATKKCILGTSHHDLDPMEDEAWRKEKEGRGETPGAETDPKKRASYFSTTARPATPTPPSSPGGDVPWFPKQFPPLAMWVAGSDTLVNGFALLDRFKKGREPNVEVVRGDVIPEYEHLDVLWAVDAIDKVGRGVAELLPLTSV
ncbi:alpha/beta-hydrolase [Ascobolus immersus RN42]|uniref:Alpha/beta-hydrolase n=1 Tax=Ascobolus immersus RN42 TaxID=1160509 RepID=A0A3N4H8I8_ASCIM|nr:alpha/beta-hydrolase [Ascobolus immersus RN42]